MYRRALGFAVLLAGTLHFYTGVAAAQVDTSRDSAWWMLTRMSMTGVSASSDPTGYEAYSTFGLDVAIRRELGRHLLVEFDVAPQSREVEFVGGSEPAPNLGSLEVLPLILLLQWRLGSYGGVQPYLGAGVSLSVFWEKSGDLNATDIPVSAGAALQLGADVPISARVFANLDLRWHGLVADISAQDTPLVELRIHPTTLGAGMGFRF